MNTTATFSAVTLEMLEAASIEPSVLFEQVERSLVDEKRPLVAGDATPRLMSLANRMSVVQVGLAGRHLLVVLDVFGIRYTERRPGSCELILPGTLPETMLQALGGRRVSQLADLGHAARLLGDLVVTGPLPAWSGAVALAVRTRWLELRIER